MKKLHLISLSILSVLFVFTACTKDNNRILDLPDQVATERDGGGGGGGQLQDQCYLTTVPYYYLAEKKPIQNAAFNEGWNYGTLDSYANGCVLGNVIYPDCELGGTATFAGLSQFDIGNFIDANGNVSAANQRLIVNMALSYAQANIGCGEGFSATITQIDFSMFPSGPFFGEEIQFAVRYQCCPVDVDYE